MYTAILTCTGYVHVDISWIFLWFIEHLIFEVNLFSITSAASVRDAYSITDFTCATFLYIEFRIVIVPNDNWYNFKMNIEFFSHYFWLNNNKVIESKLIIDSILYVKRANALPIGKFRNICNSSNIWLSDA